MNYLRKPYRGGLVFLIMLLLAGFNLPMALAASPNTAVTPRWKGGVSQGEVLVKFKKDRIDVSRFLGRVSMKSFEFSKGVVSKEVFGPQNISLVRSGTGETTEQLVARLKNDPQVEYVEPNYMRHFAVISPGDTDFSKLWGLHNTGQDVDGTVGTDDADIDAPEAWNVYAGGTDVIVAVLDSGVAYTHPDLADSMWDGSSGCKDDANNPIAGGCPHHGFDVLDNDDDPFDQDGHGTHVAGIIGAQRDNDLGVTGVHSSVKIMAVRFMGPYGGSVADEIRGINFAQNNGAKIINASFAGEDFSQAEKDAIDAFPGLFVTAAGNGGEDYVGDNNESTHIYPSDYSGFNIISVTASDQNDNLAEFANYGILSVDAVAPGENIYSTYPAFSTVLSEDFEGLTPPDMGSQLSVIGSSNNWGTFDTGETNIVLRADEANIPYANNADTAVEFNLGDLTEKAGVSLEYDVFCDTDVTDYMDVSVSNGPFFSQIDYRSMNEIEHVEVDFSAFASSDTRLRFGWVTDGSNLVEADYLGCFVDNIVVTAVEKTGENYAFLDGTSAAAPFVAGEAAMIWSRHPSLSYEQVKSIVESTGDAKASLADKTVNGNRINLLNALEVFSPHAGNGLDDVLFAGERDASNDALVTFNFSVIDGVLGLPFILQEFEYSADDGTTWMAPENGDASEALGSFSLENRTTFTSFPSFEDDWYKIFVNFAHEDFADGIAGVDQDDVRIRFKANDGVEDSPFAVSEPFSLDLFVPTAELTGTPSPLTSETDTLITVGGIGAVSYQFSLNGGDFSSLTSVSELISLSGLSDGENVLRVIAIESNGDTQPVSDATVFTWTVDTTGPSGTITNTSGNPTNDETPAFDLTISDAGAGTSSAQMRFSCDGATWSSFEAFQFTKTDFDVLSDLNGCADAEGAKTVYAQLKDSLENTGGSFSTGEFVWSLDATPPVITGLVSDSVAARTKSWVWDSPDAGAVFRFSIDQSAAGVTAGEYGSVKTAQQTSGDGTYFIHVQAKDSVGNESAVTTVSAILDNTAPVALLSGTPVGSVTNSTVTITVGGEGVTHYRFSLNSADFGSETAVENPIVFNSMSSGEKIVKVIGRDALGNYQNTASPSQAVWTIVSPGSPPGDGGGGGGGFILSPQSFQSVALPIPEAGRVLGAKTQRFPNGTVVKIRGQKKVYLILNGERKLLTPAEFKRKYSKKKVVVLSRKEMVAIKLTKKKIVKNLPPRPLEELR